MKRLYLYILLCAVVLGTGCGSGHQLPTGHALTEKRFVLTARRPTNKHWDVELVTVEADGMVVIRHRSQELRAAPGNHFGQGLTLWAHESDPAEQRAVFAYLVCRPVRVRT